MAHMVLAGDIGGTKTSVRLADIRPPASNEARPAQSVLHEEIFASRDFPDLVPLLQHFLCNASARLGQAPAVGRACFAVAGPVVENTSELTNLGWSLCGDHLARALGIARVQLINDFTAVGYGIQALLPGDSVTLQAGVPDMNAPVALIGAGTGLGEGFIVPLPGGGYRVFPSEGSHADFAPRSYLEFQVLTYLRERHQIPRVSVERVVSGMGIVSLYQFLRDQSPRQESEALANIYRLWQQELGKAEKTIDLAAEISRAALTGDDYLCAQTINLFIQAYGAEAGNLCLKLLPYGGLYVAGGIAAKILPLMQAGGFMQAFRDKGRMSAQMAKFPVHIVINPRVGLMGAALCAAQTVCDA
ncbi:MAG: glucokinase [Deltaproteobacteria bacterium]|nr:glucokinase [Deltaproteobacteria bacterium]